MAEKKWVAKSADGFVEACGSDWRCTVCNLVSSNRGGFAKHAQSVAHIRMASTRNFYASAPSTTASSSGSGAPAPMSSPPPPSGSALALPAHAQRRIEAVTSPPRAAAPAEATVTGAGQRGGTELHVSPQRLPKAQADHCTHSGCDCRITRDEVRLFAETLLCRSCGHTIGKHWNGVGVSAAHYAAAVLPAAAAPRAAVQLLGAAEPSAAPPVVPVAAAVSQLGGGGGGAVAIVGHAVAASAASPPFGGSSPILLSPIEDYELKMLKRKQLDARNAQRRADITAKRERCARDGTVAPPQLKASLKLVQYDRTEPLIAAYVQYCAASKTNNSKTAALVSSTRTPAASCGALTCIVLLFIVCLSVCVAPVTMVLLLDRRQRPSRGARVGPVSGRTEAAVVVRRPFLLFASALH